MFCFVYFCFCFFFPKGLREPKIKIWLTILLPCNTCFSYVNTSLVKKHDICTRETSNGRTIKQHFLRSTGTETSNTSSNKILKKWKKKTKQTKQNKHKADKQTKENPKQNNKEVKTKQNKTKKKKKNNNKNTKERWKTIFLYFSSFIFLAWIWLFLMYKYIVWYSSQNSAGKVVFLR